MLTIYDLLAMPEPERTEAIRTAFESASKEVFEIFVANELFDEDNYSVAIEPKETYSVNIVVDKINIGNPSIKDSFKELSEKYGHYFEGVDPVEYVREMRGEQTNSYVFTGEWCDQ